ncbi:MAG: PIN domain-containing protein [Candidatus Pacearchaeota archaeon]
MKKVVLDTNFILTCFKEKIDFFREIYFMGYKIIIPKQVLNELDRIIKSKKKLHFREQAKLASKFLENNRKSWIKKNLSEYGKNTDRAIKGFSDKEKDIIVATLDKELKRKISGLKMVIREKNKLEVV